MATDDERLMLLVEARVTDLEKQMKKASDTTGREFGKMQRHSRSATRQMEQDMTRSTTRINQALASTSTQIGVLARSFATGFVGGAFAGGFAGLITASRGVVREMAAIGDEAARAGLSTKVFQEWKTVAEDTRIPLDAMVDAFKELNIRADEFATTGKGSAADAFARLGMTPEEVEQKLKNPSALMLELIERTQRLKDTAAGTRVFDELFGGTGAERLVTTLDMADGEIGNIIDSAHEAGRIIDDEMIEKADELDRRWNAAWANFEATAKSAIMNIVATMDGLGGSLDDVYAKMSDIGNSSFFRWLLTKMDSGGLISIDIDGGVMGGMAAGDEMSALQNRVSFLSDHVTKLRGLGEDAAEAEGQLAEARARLNNRVRDITSGGSGDITSLPALIVSADTAPAGKPATTSTNAGGRESSRNTTADAALREMEAVNDLIESLTLELSLVNATDAERDKANTLRQAGAAATDEQRAQIESLIDAIHREAEAIQAAETAQQSHNEATAAGVGMSLDAIMSVADGSATAEDAVKNLTKQIMDMIVQLLVVEPLMKSIRGGGLGGLFGGAGGGMSLSPAVAGVIRGGGVGLFADGTANTGGVRGQPRGIVHGQEAVIPLPDGGRVPVQVSGPMGGSETRVKVDVGVTVDENGNLQAFVRNVSQQEANASFQQGIGQYDKMRNDLYRGGGNPR